MTCVSREECEFANMLVCWFVTGKRAPTVVEGITNYLVVFERKNECRVCTAQLLSIKVIKEVDVGSDGQRRLVETCLHLCSFICILSPA